MILNKVGNLYSDLRYFEKAEKSYTEALKNKKNSTITIAGINDNKPSKISMHTTTL
jgi:hypothetical protein